VDVTYFLIYRQAMTGLVKTVRTLSAGIQIRRFQAQGWYADKAKVDSSPLNLISRSLFNPTRRSNLGDILKNLVRYLFKPCQRFCSDMLFISLLCSGHVLLMLFEHLRECWLIKSDHEAEKTAISMA